MRTPLLDRMIDRLNRALTHLEAVVDGDGARVGAAYGEVLLARDELAALADAQPSGGEAQPARPMFEVGAIVRVKRTGAGGRVREVQTTDRRHYAAGAVEAGGFLYAVDSLIDRHSLGLFVGAELAAGPDLVAS